MHDFSKSCKHFFLGEYSSWGAHERPSLDWRRPQSTLLIIKVEFRHIRKFLNKSFRYGLGN